MNDLPKNMTYEQTVIAYTMIFGGVVHSWTEEDREPYRKQDIFNSRLRLNVLKTLDFGDALLADRINWSSVSADTNVAFYCDSTFDEDCDSSGINLIVKCKDDDGLNYTLSVELESLGRMFEDLKLLATISLDQVKEIIKWKNDLKPPYGWKDREGNSFKFKHFNFQLYTREYYNMTPKIKANQKSKPNGFKEFVNQS